jgi:hypothetical protein
MFTSLIATFVAATGIAAGVTALGLGIMAINAIDAIYGKRIEKFLSDEDAKEKKAGSKNRK